MSSAAITPRSQFAVRWSTAPALVGYAETRERAREALADLMAAAPDYRGTARGVVAYLQTLRHRIGDAFSCVVITRSATGRTVSADELRSIVGAWDDSRHQWIGD